MATQIRAEKMLKDTHIRNAKPPIDKKEYTLSDGGGLHLLIRSNGSKIWEYRFTLYGRKRKTSLGSYPVVSLERARKRRDEYRELVLDGIDPVLHKKEEKQKAQREHYTTFELIANEWLTLQTQKSQEKKSKAFKRDIFPLIGKKPITKITHPEIIDIIKKIQSRGAVETGLRLFADLRNIWKYALSVGLTDDNPFEKIDTKHAIQKPTAKKHYSKITDEVTLGRLLNDIDGYMGEPITRLYLLFISHIPLRAENAAKLKWEQVDLKNGYITIPREQMKIKDPNIPDFTMPLSKQARAILKETKELTGWGEWVFHGKHDVRTHINKETANRALQRMGYNNEESGTYQRSHSFRGTFRSLVETYHESHNASFEVKERALDHHEGNLVVRAYQHKADYTKQLSKLMQWWSDFLDKVKTSNQKEAV